MVTVEEANLNFYFRDGDYEHSFENGHREHPWLRGRSEVDVLCERVAKGFKPVASIVMQPAWSKARCAQVIAKVRAHDLTFSVQRNEWGGQCVVHGGRTGEDACGTACGARR